MFKSRTVIAALGLVALGMGISGQSALAGRYEKSGNGEAQRNIVQVAREAGSFTTLVRALEAAGLVGTLSGQGHGEFTVFAPTDAAFAKLPAGTVEGLLQDREALKKILLYHVVAGEYPASAVVGAVSLPTLNGQSLSISTVGGVKVNDANVIATDIGARNGIIHVIDTVLIPR